MHNYELKLFRPQVDAVRPPAVKHTYPAANNIAAVEHARSAFSAELSACNRAEIHHQGDGLIWEWYAPQIPGR